MAQVQQTGIGGGAALAVLVEQDILGQLELVIQLIQRAQQDADAVLIQKGHFLGVRKLNAGGVAQHPVAVQCGHQRVERLQPLVGLRLRFRRSRAVGTL